jgi:ABC-type multidrug transport system ATPase subunit
MSHVERIDILNNVVDQKDLFTGLVSTPITLSWHHLSYVIQNVGQKGAKVQPPEVFEKNVVSRGGKDKVVLWKCSGQSVPGQLRAIMGPSGAGKTSLLNLLAGRVPQQTKHQVSGFIKSNGQVIDPFNYATTIAYVMQDDCLFASATPREALQFSASLRLPATTPEKEIICLVENMIVALGLEKCADNMIGGGLSKGISGGERKRTSIGVELVTRPSVVFLDEPTSGLDSFAAYNVVRLLHNLSRAGGGTTVICTIHQPSSEVFNVFDELTLLGDGSTIYHGPVGGMTEVFRKRGYPCPRNFNPADYVMFLAQTEEHEKIAGTLIVEEEEDWQKHAKLAKERIAKVKREKEVERRKREGASYSSLLSGGATVRSDTAGLGQESGRRAGPGLVYDTAGSDADSQLSATLEDLQHDQRAHKSSWTTQIKLLFQREYTGLKREKVGFAFKFITTAVFNCLFGCIFLGAGSRDETGEFADINISSHFGAITQVTIGAFFAASTPITLKFPLERPVFIREYATGTYGAVPYFLSKVAMELPISLAQCLMALFISYFLIDLQGNFFLLWMVLWLNNLSAASASLLAGCVVTDPSNVSEIAPFISTPQIIFTGFFIRIDQIPAALRWLQYLCSLKWSLNLLLLVEFDNCQDQELCDQFVLAPNNISKDDAGLYVGVLIGIFVLFRCVCSILSSIPFPSYLSRLFPSFPPFSMCHYWIEPPPPHPPTRTSHWCFLP